MPSTTTVTSLPCTESSIQHRVQISERQTIPIFFCVDDGYTPFLAVAMHSLIENASPDFDYDIHVLHENMSESNQERLARLAQGHPNTHIFFTAMDASFAGLQDRLNQNNRLRCDFFTATIFFRLFIPALFPQYDRGIYLDSDIVVPGDISRMWQIPLGEGKRGSNLIGAIHDYSVEGVPVFANYIEQAVGIPVKEYINSGILLMDMKGLREANLDQRFVEILNRYHLDTIAPDQDYLNALVWGRVCFLPYEWDAMPLNGKEPVENPQLVHYNLFDKPQHYSGIPYERYFWQYAQDCGFIDEIRAHKAAYTDEQRMSDHEAQERMGTNAARLVSIPTSFRTIFESGKESRL